MPKGEIFTQTVLEHLSPGSKVLDGGAGEGKFARMFAAKGTEVVAVDVQGDEAWSEPGIIWKKQSLEGYLLEQKAAVFDVIFLRNVLQFIKKETVLHGVLPKALELVKPGGIIAIETFSAAPVPPFVITSAYSLAELQEVLPGKLLMGEEYIRDGKDMKGEPRRFFITDIVIEKQS